MNIMFVKHHILEAPPTRVGRYLIWALVPFAGRVGFNPIKNIFAPLRPLFVPCVRIVQQIYLQALFSQDFNSPNYFFGSVELL